VLSVSNRRFHRFAQIIFFCVHLRHLWLTLVLSETQNELGRAARKCCNPRVDDEFITLTESAGLLDLSNRSRLCLLGADRARFLHGQVTNDINGLAEHTGCYAALVNAKGKMESDLFAYRLAEEILLDFEPGLADAVQARLESFIIAEDVEVADVTPHFGLLSVQGPKAPEVLAALELPAPETEFALTKTVDEIFVVNRPRLGSMGFDLFVPVDAMEDLKLRLAKHAPLCGEAAFEKARVLATIPRFGKDFTANNLAPEGGIEARAISYAKGCYIGQEIISRIRSRGKVNRILRGLRLDGATVEGDAIYLGEKQVGTLSSVITEPDAALAIVHRDAAELGTALRVDTINGGVNANTATLPFEKFTL
jgi:folate-binding protein YgfZ